MADNKTLKAVPRDASGKGVARKLRKAGRVPAVLYGHGDQPRGMSVDAHELELLMASSGVNAIVRLEMEGEGSQDVLLREVQMHPYRPEVQHIDFFHVHAGERVHVRVPVRLNGTPVGVHTDGGILDQVLYELDVECMPDRIPAVIEVDVTELTLNHSVRVSDLPSTDYKVMQDGELPIASVVGASRNESLETDEPGTEPALIRTGGEDAES